MKSAFFFPLFFRRRYVVGAAVFSVLCGAMNAKASDFALGVSPPRFELQVKAGERNRQVLEITNVSAEAVTLTAKTADWSVGADNSAIFFDELQPGSCRPWVALEKRELTVSGARPYRFRFEINVPADAKPEECRLAILLQGQPQLVKTPGGLDIPFAARLGVIIYAAVAGAEPKLAVAGAEVRDINGKATPVLMVRNSGNAHGRLSGFLAGTDASNTALEFSPAGGPILAGETRPIPLTATRPGDPETTVQVKFPVTVTGKIEWGKDKADNIEQRFAQ